MYLISFIPISFALAYLSKTNILIEENLLRNLDRMMIILMFFVFILFLFLVLNPPIFSPNPNIERVLFRKIFYINYLLWPMQTLATILIVVLLRISFQKKYLFFLIIIILNGFLSGFRGATINPLLLYVLISYATSSGTIYFIKKNYTIILLIFIVFVFLVLSTYLRYQDLPVIQVINEILVNRIFFENYELNHFRYINYYQSFGLQYGYTYILDLLSILKIEPLSFQSILSGGGVLTMTTPYYSELFVNFGDYSFVFSFIITVFVFSIVYFFIKLLPKYESLLFRFTFATGVSTSILQASLTKFMFVDLPKLIFIFLFIYIIRRIIYAKKS